MGLLNRICYHLYMLVPMRAPAWVSDRAIQHMDYRSALIHITVGRFVLRRGDGQQIGTTPPIKRAGMSRLEMIYDGCQMTLTLDEEHNTATP